VSFIIAGEVRCVDYCLAVSALKQVLCHQEQVLLQITEVHVQVDYRSGAVLGFHRDVEIMPLVVSCCLCMQNHLSLSVHSIVHPE